MKCKTSQISKKQSGMSIQASICLGCIGNIGTTRQAIGRTFQKPKWKAKSSLGRTVKVPEDMEFEQIRRNKRLRVRTP